MQPSVKQNPPKAVKEMRAAIYHFLKDRSVADIQFEDEAILLVLDNGEAFLVNGEVSLGSMSKPNGVGDSGNGGHGSTLPA